MKFFPLCSWWWITRLMSISSSSSSPVKYWVSHEDGYIPNFYHSGFFYSTLFFGGSSKDKERKLVPTSQAFLALLSSRLIAAHDIRSLIVQRLHFCKRQEKSNFKKLKVETQSCKYTILQKKNICYPFIWRTPCKNMFKWAAAFSCLML
jgi:hypothetical protein